MKAIINRKDYLSYRIPFIDEFEPGFEYEYLNFSISKLNYEVPSNPLCRSSSGGKGKIVKLYLNTNEADVEFYVGSPVNITFTTKVPINTLYSKESMYVKWKCEPTKITTEYWRKGIVGSGFEIHKKEHIINMLQKGTIIADIKKTNVLETKNQKSMKITDRNDDIKGRIYSYLDSIYKNDIADLLQNSSKFHIDLLLESNKDKARKTLKYIFPTLEWKDVKIVINQLWSVALRSDKKLEPLIVKQNNKLSRKIHDTYISRRLKFERFEFCYLNRDKLETLFVFSSNLTSALNKLYKTSGRYYKDPLIRIAYCKDHKGNLLINNVEDINNPGNDKKIIKWKERYLNPDYNTTIYLKNRNKKSKLSRQKTRLEKAFKLNSNTKSIASISKTDKKVCMALKDSDGNITEVMRVWKSEADSFNSSWKYTSKSVYKKFIQNSEDNNPETSLHENREILVIPSHETADIVPEIKYKWIRSRKSILKRDMAPKRIARLCTGTLQSIEDRYKIRSIKKKLKEDRRKSYLDSISREKKSKIDRTANNKCRKQKHIKSKNVKNTNTTK